MNNLKFPLPDKIQEVLQPNQSAIEDDRTSFPNLAELNKVRQRSADEVRRMIASDPAPLLLDVREPQEYRGELGHIPGSVLLPLKDLAARAGEFDAHRNRDIVAICRSGVRSTTAAAILSGLGFERVFNLRDGMVGWSDSGYPIER
jgi:rhodanese-related sulfurtransferase